MNFIFERSAQHLMSDRREWMRYWVEHEKIGCVSTSRRVIFCLLYKHTNDDVFDDFLKISDHFPKISEDFPKLLRRPDGCFQTFCKHFSKITEDCRRWLKKIWRCFDHTSTNITREKCYQKGMISSQCER